MAAGATLLLKVLADATQATKTLDQASGKASRFGSTLNKASVVAGAGLAALGAAGVSAAKAAADDAAAADQLALALKNSTGASDEGVASVEDWISKTSAATAVADDQLRPALATLARATGDVSKSQDAMAVALDVSAATGKDVEAVSAALAKGYAGNTAALGRLVPGMDKAVLASGDMDKVMAELARTTGGAAAKSAKSAAGQMRGMEIAMGEAQEEIGAALLPAMSALAKLLSSVARFVQDNSRVVLILGGILAGLAATVLGVNAAYKVYLASQKLITAATKAWAAAQWLINAAMSANPIGLIIAGVTALVAIIVVLWKKNEGFRKVVTAVWNKVLSVMRTVWQWVSSNARKLFEMLSLPFRLYLAYVKSVVRLVLAVLRTVIGWMSSVWSGILKLLKGPFEKGLAFIKTVVQAIKDSAATVLEWMRNTWAKLTDLIVNPIKAAADLLRWVVDGIRSVFESAFGLILKAIEKVSDALGKVKDFGKGVIDAINPFSIVAPPAPAPAVAPSVLARTTGRAVPSSRGGGVTINVNGALDPQQTARAVQRLLRDADVRAGRRRFA